MMLQLHLNWVQFAYQPQTGVEDAIISWLNHIYILLDQPGCTARVMVIYFSCYLTQSSRLEWESGRGAGWALPGVLHCGLWLTDHMYFWSTVCVSERLVQWELFISCLSFTLQTSANTERPATFKRLQMTLLWLEASEMERRLSAGLCELWSLNRTVWWFLMWCSMTWLSVVSTSLAVASVKEHRQGDRSLG